MTNTQVIRRPLFDGTREVKAIWFDCDLIGVAEARRRILCHWCPDARLYEVQGGYLLEFARSQLLHCANLDGLALCMEGGILSSAPLAADERSLTAAGTIWLIRGATADQIELMKARKIDPASWIDLGAVAVLKPLQLPRPVSAQIAEMPEPNSELRTILNGSIPAASKESQKFLRQAKASMKNDKSRGLVKSMIVGAVFAPLGLLGLIAGMFVTGQVSTGSGGSKVKPSGLSPFAKRFSDALAKIAMLTRISKVIGWRQAAYLRKMMDLFENGDLHDALRHAIPLDSLDNIDKRQALGAPSARESLEIVGPNHAGSSIGLDASLRNHLRKTYRNTFERLDREGKIDEATFVLAELLKCGEEAVTYLERKGRLKQAAQLAESMELSAEIIARLWCLAGDFDRAIRVARLGRAFSGVVKLLETKQHPHAKTMRTLWAQDLASSGNLIEAVEAIWPLQDERATALNWLLQAGKAGGDLGIRALARQLALMPESIHDWRGAIFSVLQCEGEEGYLQRTRMAQELLSLPNQSTATRQFAAAIVRQVIPELMAGMNQIDHRDLRKLIDLSDAAVLKADLPTLHLPKLKAEIALHHRNVPITLVLDERGLQPIHDACALDGGNTLLALGEIGVSLIDKKGRQLLYFPIPAHHLVPSENGQRALALARRDGVMRISQIDLITRKMSDWILQDINFWDESYDGLIWNSVINNRLVAVDTTRPHLSISWQVGDLPGNIVAYAGCTRTQAMLIASGDDVQQWRYALPTRRLTQRDSFPLPTQDVWRLLPNPDRKEPLTLKLLVRDDLAILGVHQGNGFPDFEIPLPALKNEPTVSLKEDLLLIRYQVNLSANWYCIIVDIQSHKTLIEIEIANALAPQFRASANTILVFDQAGRLLHIDRRSSQCTILNVV